MPVREIAISNPFAPSTLFLKDVIVAASGTVYATDNRNSAIFVVNADQGALLWAIGPVRFCPQPTSRSSACRRGSFSFSLMDIAGITGDCL